MEVPRAPEFPRPSAFVKAVKRCPATGRLYPMADPTLTFVPGQTLALPGVPRVCAWGFHACAAVQAVFVESGPEWYHIDDEDTVVVEVVLGEDAVCCRNGIKWVSTAVTVVRELSRQEVAAALAVPWTKSTGSCFLRYVNLMLDSGPEDEPALGWPGGMEWRRQGVRHRPGGRPAIVYTNGNCEHWVQGVRRWVTPRSWWARLVTWSRFSGGSDVGEDDDGAV
jgi:hypothetical protein